MRYSNLLSLKWHSHAYNANFLMAFHAYMFNPFGRGNELIYLLASAKLFMVLLCFCVIVSAKVGVQNVMYLRCEINIQIITFQ